MLYFLKLKYLSINKLNIVNNGSILVNCFTMAEKVEDVEVTVVDGRFISVSGDTLLFIFF